MRCRVSLVSLCCLTPWSLKKPRIVGADCDMGASLRAPGGWRGAEVNSLCDRLTSWDTLCGMNTEHVHDASSELLELLYTVFRGARRGPASSPSTPGQLRFLRTLARCGSAQRPGALADALGVAPRSVTSKVDAAEADGLVRRLPDPSDRRATLVELTPAGVEMLHEA